MQMTEGARLLRKRLDEDPEQTQVIAKALGVSTQAIWTWKTGSRRPDAHLREGLRVLTGISVETWLIAEERRVLQRAEKAAANGRG